MYDLPEELLDLSSKRRATIWKLAVEQRQDAAMNAVVMGLKELNQLYGFGLWRLSVLSSKWQEDIMKFYIEGSAERYPREGLPTGTLAGDAGGCVNAQFPDLSPRRKRFILAFLNQQREDAQHNAAAIGLDTIRASSGFGKERVERLVQEWAGDMRNFYQDRDIQEPRLQAWIEEIGFLYENGKLEHYRSTETGKIVHKRTAERQNRRDTNG